MTNIQVIGGSQPNVILNERKNDKSNINSTKDYYASYTKNASVTLTTFNNKMSDILKRSIQRLNNIETQIRDCVYNIGNQEALYLNRCSGGVNGKNSNFIKAELLLNKEKNDNLISKAATMDKTNLDNKMDLNHPSCTSLNEILMSINDLEPQQCQSQLSQHFRFDKKEMKSKENEVTHSLQNLQECNPKKLIKKDKVISKKRKEKKSRIKMKVLTTTPIKTSRKRKSRDLINRFSNIENEEAVRQKIKKMHKSISLQRAKLQECAVVLPEKIDSNLETLREKYTKHCSSRRKKKVVAKYSCEVFIPKKPKQYGRLKSQDKQKIWIGPKLIIKAPASKVSHGSVVQDKGTISPKENNLTRKYASENVRDRGIKTVAVKSKTSYKGEIISLNENKQDWSVIMHTERPQRMKYELKQNSVLKSNSILDEITLKDLAPLKAEYPRKDNIMNFEMPLQETFLNKLVNHDTKSLEFLLNTKGFHRKLRKSRFKRNRSSGNFEDEYSVSEEAISKTTPKLDNEPRTGLLTSDYARKLLKKYMLDPNKDYSQTLIVMPVFVKYDKNPAEIKNIYKNGKMLRSATNAEIKLQEFNKTKICDNTIRPNLVKPNLVVSQKTHLCKQNSFTFEPNRVTMGNEKPSSLVRKVINNKKPDIIDKPKKIEAPQVISFLVNEKKDSSLSGTSQHSSKNKSSSHKKVVSVGKIKNDRSNMKDLIEGIENKFKKALNTKEANRAVVLSSLEKEMESILLNMPIESTEKLALVKKKGGRASHKSSRMSLPQSATNKHQCNLISLKRAQSAIYKTKVAGLEKQIFEGKYSGDKIKDVILEENSNETTLNENLDFNSSSSPVTPDSVLNEEKSKVSEEIEAKIAMEQQSINKKKVLKENLKLTHEYVADKSTSETLKSYNLILNENTAGEQEEPSSEWEKPKVITEISTLQKLTGCKSDILEDKEVMSKQSLQSSQDMDLKEIEKTFLIGCGDNFNMENGDINYELPPTTSKPVKACSIYNLLENVEPRIAMKKTKISEQILEKWKILENPLDIGEFIEDEDLYEDIIKPSSDLLKLKPEDKTVELKILEKELGNEMKKFCNEINEVIELIKPTRQEDLLEDNDEITPRNKEMSTSTSSFFKKSEASIQQLAIEQFYAAPVCEAFSHESSDVSLNIETNKSECVTHTFARNKSEFNKALIKELLTMSKGIKTINNEAKIDDLPLDKVEPIIDKENVITQESKIKHNSVKETRDTFHNVMLISLYSAIFATVFCGLNLKYNCLS